MKSHLVSNWALSRLDVCEKVLFFFKMSTTLKMLVRSRFWKQILQKFRSKYFLIGILKYIYYFQKQILGKIPRKKNILIFFIFLGSETIGLCPDCEQELSDLNESICKRCLKRRSERKEIITEIAETEAKYGRDLR